MSTEEEHSVEMTEEEMTRLTNVGFYGRLAEGASVALNRGEEKITIGLITFRQMCEIIAEKQFFHSRGAWFDMKSAPRDGSPVFLAHLEGDWELIKWRWSEERKCWETEGAYQVWFDDREHPPAYWSMTPMDIQAALAELVVEDPA